MEGADVKELQTDLITLGFDCGKWGADGEFVGEGFVEVSVDVVDGEGVDGESVFLPGPSVKVHSHSHIRVGDVGLHGL